MTTLLAEFTGQLSIAITDQRIGQLALRSAVEVAGHGETLIVIDAGGCFNPDRLTQSARIGAIDAAPLMKHLHICRAVSISEFEMHLDELDSLLRRMNTRHVLISDPLHALYDPSISTRDAARALGRLKTRLEQLAQNGAIIVVLCSRKALRGDDLGTRAHFLSSLCASANRVYSRNNT